MPKRHVALCKETGMQQRNTSQLLFTYSSGPFPPQIIGMCMKVAWVIPKEVKWVTMQILPSKITKEILNVAGLACFCSVYLPLSRTLRCSRNSKNHSRCEDTDPELSTSNNSRGVGLNVEPLLIGHRGSSCQSSSQRDAQTWEAQNKNGRLWVKRSYETREIKTTEW